MDVTPRFKEPKKLRRPGLARVSPKRAALERELWQAKQVVRARSGGWCEVPGCARRMTDVHHVVPRSGGKPDHSPVNLVALCPDHHARAHAEPQWARDMNLKRRRCPDELEPKEGTPDADER